MSENNAQAGEAAIASIAPQKNSDGFVAYAMTDRDRYFSGKGKGVQVSDAWITYTQNEGAQGQQCLRVARPKHLSLDECFVVGEALKSGLCHRGSIGKLGYDVELTWDQFLLLCRAGNDASKRRPESTSGLIAELEAAKAVAAKNADLVRMLLGLKAKPADIAKQIGMSEEEFRAAYPDVK